MDDSGSPEPPARRKRRARVAINLTNCKYEVVADCAVERGWVVVTDEDGRPWNVCWTDTSVATERVMALKSYQKINHFPGMSMLCRKNGLARSLTRMHRVCGKEYAFFPESYVLPQEMSEFKAQFSGRRSPSNVWIVKPDHGCQVRFAGQECCTAHGPSCCCCECKSLHSVWYNWVNGVAV